jgi:FMN phosphatase YigB (HAD superfamily)
LALCLLHRLPKYGFKSWEAWLRQICKRLGIKVDDKTINDWGCLYRDENWKLYPDAFTFQCEKSNPKIYRETLKALNVKPEQAVMVGDEEDVDILIPKRLGMYTIFLDRNRKREPSLLKVQTARYS